jgi:hypothetical protein
VQKKTATKKLQEHTLNGSIPALTAGLIRICGDLQEHGVHVNWLGGSKVITSYSKNLIL